MVIRSILRIFNFFNEEPIEQQAVKSFGPGSEKII